MQKIYILFFGSTHDSVTVLNGIKNNQLANIEIIISAAVTQPPRPQGRKAIITPTPVELWAVKQNIPVHSFQSNPEKKTTYQNLQYVIDTLCSYTYDFVLSASYGQLIPWEVIDKAPHKGLNIHPSLLPRWRGADPTPWTIVSGDKECGVTLVGLSKSFDEGNIYAQQKIQTPQKTFHETLRQQLFEMGTTILLDNIEDIFTGKNKGVPQIKSQATYARRLTREDGYIPWTLLKKMLTNQSIQNHEYPPLIEQCLKNAQSNELVSIQTLLQRAHYALSPWPGIWTIVSLHNQNKRMKILSLESSDTTFLLGNIQLEGSKPQPWKQIQELVQS